MKHLVDSLLKNYTKLENSIPIEPCYQPNRSEVVRLIEKLRCLLFPGYFDKKYLSQENLYYHVGSLLEEVKYLLNKQLLCLLNKKKEDNESIKNETNKIIETFFKKLPKIREIIATDIEATFDGDPAATDREEIIISYPGIYAISIYRLAHELYILNVPMLPRIMTEQAHSMTGIDIHPGAKIGAYLFIDHGTGIVIGETTVIGKHVKIYQGVTLGALSTKGGQSLKGKKRHPTIEDNVTIYSGASIFGGDTVIGKNSVLGSSVFVTNSIKPGSKLISANK